MGTADRPGAIPHPTLVLRIERELDKIKVELVKSMTKHAPMHSPHEGMSVIKEEVDELWEHVKADTGRTAGARKEALQVAAMGLRYVLDLCEDAVNDRGGLHAPSCAIHWGAVGCTCRAHETSPLG